MAKVATVATHALLPGDHSECSDAGGCKVQGRRVECCGGRRHCRACAWNAKHEDDRALLSGMDFDEYGVEQWR